MKILDFCFGIYKEEEENTKLLYKEHVYIKNVKSNIKEKTIDEIGEALKERIKINESRNNVKVKFIYYRITGKVKERTLF